MDVVTLGAAISAANKYTDSVALNGVPVQYPKVNSNTQRWEIFDPVSNSYIDTGIMATGIVGAKGDKGDKGDQGIQGIPGNDGADGKSAYEIALENGFTGTEQEWLDSLKGSGEGGTFTNSNPTPTAIGGIPAGSTFNSVSIQDMFNRLLYPFQAPSFSAFGIQGQTTPLEVGASIQANRQFTWTLTNSSNVESNSIEILDVTGSTTIASGLSASPYNSTIPAITKNAVATHTFRIRATNIQNAQFQRDYSVNWQFLRYVGKSTNGTLVEADIKNLSNKVLAANSAGTFSFAEGAGYCYIVGLTKLASFKNSANNLDVPFEEPYQVSVENQYGVSTTYWVHRSFNQLGGAITIVAS